MNISEIEKLIGISKQTIRFYEKEGLISPKRNRENQYREYDEQDIRQLKLIYVLRKTGLSIIEIKKVLDGEITMAAAVNARRKELLEERKEQDELLDFCNDLKMQSVEWIDVDKYVEKIHQKKKNGDKFFEIIEEYKQVYQGEWKKEFLFFPDTFIESPREFTNELLRYAKSIDADITITKESMEPEFVLNGVEYSAVRVNTGFYGIIDGPTVWCVMKYPKLAEPDNVIGLKKKIMQMMAQWLPSICIFMIMLILFMGGTTLKEIVVVLIIAVIVFIIAAWYFSKK